MAKGTSQLIGIILLAIGIGQLVWGMSLYGSFSNELSRAIDGSVDEKTLVLLIGGGVFTLLGLIRLLRK